MSKRKDQDPQECSGTNDAPHRSKKEKEYQEKEDKEDKVKMDGKSNLKLGESLSFSKDKTYKDVTIIWEMLDESRPWNRFTKYYCFYIPTLVFEEFSIENEAVESLDLGLGWSSLTEEEKKIFAKISQMLQHKASIPVKLMTQEAETIHVVLRQESQSIIPLSGLPWALRLIVSSKVERPEWTDAFLL
jgi:hypothetical protein